jgi:hypothetical protein
LKAAITTTPKTGSAAPRAAPTASQCERELEAPADRCGARWVEGFAEQPVTTRVLPDAVERQRRHVKRDAVEDDRGTLAVSLAEGACKNGGREREKRHHHQQQGVEEQHETVGGTDVVEHDVVVRPHLPDEQERDRVGEIRRHSTPRPCSRCV